MKTKLFLTLACVLAMTAVSRAAGSNPAGNAATPALTVAVFDFESKDEAVRNLGPKVATLVSAYLSADPRLVTVERAELEKALGEQELGLSGTVTPDTAAKVGQLTGAKVLVTGRVFEVGDELMIVAKTIGTETSVVVGELVKGASTASISDLSEQLAKKIADDIAQKSDMLVAKPESRDDHIARIKKELDGKKLPVVSVRVAEQHFGQPVIDPAVQTELGLILQQCGFTVVDELSTNKAEVEITGEAFSEFGMQKGNLKSCRARIEIKARDLASGKILVIDRQTSVAVDLAEHVAAKTALQNGAGQLAERMLPKLAR